MGQCNYQKSLNHCSGYVILNSVSKFHIADCSRDLLNLPCHPCTSRATDIAGPINGSGIPYLSCPLLTYLGKIVGENIGGTGAIGTVHNSD